MDQSKKNLLIGIGSALLGGGVVGIGLYFGVIKQLEGEKTKLEGEKTKLEGEKTKLEEKLINVKLDFLSKLEVFNPVDPLGPIDQNKLFTFFSGFNTNRDGFVTKEEIQSLIEKYEMPQYVLDNWEKVFDNCDVNKDGKLSKEEFGITDQKA